MSRSCCSICSRPEALLPTIVAANKYVLISAILFKFVFSASSHDSPSKCTVVCNCADPDECCDNDSGECPLSGCKDGPPTGQGFRWSGPGCRIGEWITFHCKDGQNEGQGFLGSGPGLGWSKKHQIFWINFFFLIIVRNVLKLACVKYFYLIPSGNVPTL